MKAPEILSKINIFLIFITSIHGYDLALKRKKSPIFSELNTLDLNITNSYSKDLLLDFTEDAYYVEAFIGGNGPYKLRLVQDASSIIIYNPQCENCNSPISCSAESKCRIIDQTQNPDLNFQGTLLNGNIKLNSDSFKKAYYYVDSKIKESTRILEDAEDPTYKDELEFNLTSDPNFARFLKKLKVIPRPKKSEISNDTTSNNEENNVPDYKNEYDGIVGLSIDPEGKGLFVLAAQKDKGKVYSSFATLLKNIDSPSIQFSNENTIPVDDVEDLEVDDNPFLDVTLSKNDSSFVISTVEIGDQKLKFPKRLPFSLSFYSSFSTFTDTQFIDFVYNMKNEGMKCEILNEYCVCEAKPDIKMPNVKFTINKQVFQIDGNEFWTCKPFKRGKSRSLQACIPLIKKGNSLKLGTKFMEKYPVFVDYGNNKMSILKPATPDEDFLSFGFNLFFLILVTLISIIGVVGFIRYYRSLFRYDGAFKVSNNSMETSDAPVELKENNIANFNYDYDKDEEL